MTIPIKELIRILEQVRIETEFVYQYVDNLPLNLPSGETKHFAWLWLNPTDYCIWRIAELCGGVDLHDTDYGFHLKIGSTISINMPYTSIDGYAEQVFGCVMHFTNDNRRSIARQWEYNSNYILAFIKKLKRSFRFIRKLYLYRRMYNPKWYHFLFRKEHMRKITRRIIQTEWFDTDKELYADYNYLRQ